MNKIKQETAKLKEMNFKEKREYIWEYYKIHILITIFLLFMFGSLINTWFINPPKDAFLYLGWFGRYETDENMTALASHLNKLVDDPEKQEVQVTSFFTSEDPQYNSAMFSRLMAMMSAAELDIFIMDELNLLDLAMAGYLAPLDQLSAELQALDPALYERLSQMTVEAVYKPVEEDEAQTGLYGINLVDCPLLTSLGVFNEDLYLGVVANTEKVPDIARAVQVLYE